MSKTTYTREEILRVLKTRAEVDLVPINDDSHDTHARLDLEFGNHPAVTTCRARDILWRIVTHAQAGFTFGLVSFDPSQPPSARGGGLGKPGSPVHTWLLGPIVVVRDELHLRHASGAVFDMATGMQVT